MVLSAAVPVAFLNAGEIMTRVTGGGLFKSEQTRVFPETSMLQRETGSVSHVADATP
ncbi:MAG TPA: hypothetical protein VF332_01220 [Vicinamibacterales bacterium]